MTDVLNKYEKKKTFADSLRRWTNTKIRELIEMMNKDVTLPGYEEETFQILFEICFAYEVDESVHALMKLV